MEFGVEPIDIHLFGMLIDIGPGGKVNLLQYGVGQCLLVAGNKIHRTIRLAFHIVSAIAKIDGRSEDIIFRGITFGKVLYPTELALDDTLLVQQGYDSLHVLRPLKRY